jgi:pimeloyl-ACP methyl ester carboxylesterase
MQILFKDGLFDGQFLRIISHTYYGGADLGECFTTARRIKEGDNESWYREWSKTAERVYKLGEESLAKGHKVSAREAFLRSSNYFRGSYIFMMKTPVDPRLVEAFDRQTEAFRQAGALFSTPFQQVRIPYENTTLPGYFYAVDDSGQPRPTLLLPGGYDSTAEELYFFNVAAGLRRGYNCLVFDGPGQGEPLIKQGLYFRPDFENVLKPVVDFALTLPEVDPAKLALVGLSWGGYLAPRGASGEHRLAALVADPGEWDQFKALKDRLPLPSGLTDKIFDHTPVILNPVFKFMLKKRQISWALRRIFWVHGVSGPQEYFKIIRQFKISDRVLEITCPTLVCQAEEDDIAAYAKVLYDHLRCPKTFMLFKAEEGASEHCETGARSLFHQRMFDWLDETLKIPTEAAVPA